MKKKTSNNSLVLFIALMNGWSVILFALVCMLIAILFKSGLGVCTCLAIIASGALELTGRSRLKTGKLLATEILMGSQFLFFVAISVYAGYQLWTFDAASIIKHIPVDYYELVLKDVYTTDDALERVVRLIHHIIYISLIATSFLYQGGLLVFYKVSTKGQSVRTE